VKLRVAWLRFRDSGSSFPSSDSRRFGNSASVRTASSTWSVTLTAIFSRSFTGAEIFPDSHPLTSQTCKVRRARDDAECGARGAWGPR